jgi:hypothetical protein
MIFAQDSVILQVPTIALLHGVKEPHWLEPLSSPQPRNKLKISKSDFRMKVSLIGAEKSTPSRRAGCAKCRNPVRPIP